MVTRSALEAVRTGRMLKRWVGDSTAWSGFSAWRCGHPALRGADRDGGPGFVGVFPNAFGGWTEVTTDRLALQLAPPVAWSMRADLQVRPQLGRSGSPRSARRVRRDVAGGYPHITECRSVCSRAIRTGLPTGTVTMVFTDV